MPDVHEQDRPATLIVQHPKENLAKCSVWPLRAHPGIRIVRWPVTAESLGLDAGSAVRLEIDGPVLGPADADRTLLLLDGTWRLAGRMRPDFESVPARSLPPGLRTAYPRTSKLYEDPDAGLATVEALWAAHRCLGRPDADALLADYRWAEAFLAANADWSP